MNIQQFTRGAVDQPGWTKTHLLACPQCGAQFLGYEREDMPLMPNVFDQDSPNVFQGNRQTCGHPECWEAEDEYQFRKRLAYRNSHPQPAKPSPITKKKAIS